ncbi:MAG: metallopeptidase [Desulfurococcales archaeon]|nr:metallopeptidase [Desulfurococcales archaeon]
MLSTGLFPHITPERVHCIKSLGSRSSAIARIYGLPRPWILVLGINPGYIIEVLEEKYTRLPPEKRLEVIIHELLHIPYTASGALRPHGKLVNNKRVRQLVRQLRKKKPVYNEIIRLLEETC